MRSILVALLCLGFLSLPARAQNSIDPKVADAVRALVAKTGGVDQYNRMLDLVFGQMVQGTQQANPGRSAQEVEAAFRDLVLPELKAIGPAILEVSIAAYAKRFTLPEINELSAFYDTPIGKKLLRESPELMADIMQSAGNIAQQVIMRALEKNRDALRQRGVQVPL